MTKEMFFTIYLLLIIPHAFLFLIMWNIDTAIAKRDAELYKWWNSIIIPVGVYKASCKLMFPWIVAIIFIVFYPAIYLTALLSLTVTLVNGVLCLLSKMFSPMNDAFWDKIIAKKTNKSIIIQCLYENPIEFETIVINVIKEVNYGETN